MYDRNELEKIFIKKKGVSDGDWLLRVQSSPFFVADRYGFDLKSSIIISKESIAEFVEMLTPMIPEFTSGLIGAIK